MEYFIDKRIVITLSESEAMAIHMFLKLSFEQIDLDKVEEEYIKQATNLMNHLG